MRKLELGKARQLAWSYTARKRWLEWDLHSSSAWLIPLLLPAIHTSPAGDRDSWEHLALLGLFYSVLGKAWHLQRAHTGLPALLTCWWHIEHPDCFLIPHYKTSPASSSYTLAYWYNLTWLPRAEVLSHPGCVLHQVKPGFPLSHSPTQQVFIDHLLGPGTEVSRSNI